MTHPLTRRLALGFAGVFALMLIFIGARVLSWAPEPWLLQQLNDAGFELDAGAFGTSQNQGFSRVWTDVAYSTEHNDWVASRVQVNLNPVSVLIGQPQIRDIQITNGFWFSQSPGTADALPGFTRLLDALAPQRLMLNGGNLVIGDLEITQIEAAFERRGSSDRYNSQITTQWAHNDLRASSTAQAILQWHNEGVRLSDAEFSARLTSGPWPGIASGQWREARIDSDQLAIDFLSWHSVRQPLGNAFPKGLEWAGGLEALRYSGDGWVFAELDSALAFSGREPNTTHRLGTRGQFLKLRNGQLSGLSAVSYREETVGTQPSDITATLQGEVTASATDWHWQAPKLLIGVTENSQQRSHNLSAATLALEPSNQQWALTDGDWIIQIDGEPEQSYGFGVLNGDWPGLSLNSAPDWTTPLNTDLTLLRSNLEWIDALRRELVSTPGS
ncbi:hypothetical protein [Saccharospirillum impatiens]|uniref:hypothetical protein n=1 Tax=Saccharospirillum impatiens TaxID=169438 RepID=UPI0003FC91D7|nr:hypothetical protein [Saccharospirillum impatiens]